jgi:cytochrome c-L
MNVFTTAGLQVTGLATALAIGLAAASAQDDTAPAEREPLVFTHALDDQPLDVYTPREGEEFTEAVHEFHVTGENPHDGVDEAIADGQVLYNRNCRACHGVEGAGGMGPALNDDYYRRPRAATDKGEFEIIYGGSAGAMQAFGNRLDQDDILRVMAFIDTLGDAE